LTRLLIRPEQRAIQRLLRHPIDLRLSPDGRWIAENCHEPGTEQVFVRILDALSSEEFLRCRTIDDFGLGGVGFCFSQDSRLAALTAPIDDKVYVEIWDIAARRLVARLPGHYAALALSPDGSLLAGARKSQTIDLIDLESTTIKKVLEQDDPRGG